MVVDPAPVRPKDPGEFSSYSAAGPSVLFHVGPQLERLEDFLLFELNSGISDDIKYIDLRYKNALAVGYKNTEKTI